MFQAENSIYRDSGEEKIFKELKEDQSDNVHEKGESIKWGFRGRQGLDLRGFLIHITSFHW